MFATVAILSAAGFTSCNNSDDDPYVPTPSSTQQSNKVSVYSAYINENALNVCDITLTLYSGNKTKVVKLDKANGKLDKIEYEFMGQSLGSLPAYRFDFDNVDGNKGIDRVEANSTLKPEAEGIVNALDPEKEYYFAACSNFCYAEFMPSGNYSFGAFTTSGTTAYHRANLIKDMDGKKVYETLPNKFNIGLTKKKPGM